MIERDRAFHRVIAERFPQVRVLQGDAANLRRLLQDAGIGKVKGVVSSLPLLSIPDRICRQIVAESMAVLDDRGVFVQFTYGPASPVSKRIAADLGLAGRRASWVMDNIPPASVWRYQRRDAVPESQRPHSRSAGPLQKRSA